MQDSLAQETTVRRPGRPTGWMVALAVAAAGLWSVALVVGVGTVRVIGGTTMDSTGATASVSKTLVDEVGSGAAYGMASLPLVATILVGILACLRPRTGPVVGAFVVLGVLGTFNFLAMLTIGIFFLPSTAALLVAALVMLARATQVTPPRDPAR